MSCTLDEFTNTASNSTSNQSNTPVVAIAGGRNFSDRFGLFINDGAEVIERIVDTFAPFSVDEIGAIRHGDCRGVDQWGEAFAQAQNLPVGHFPAHFDILGGQAGPLRNAVIAMVCDHLIAIMDETDDHPGTRNMRAVAEQWDCNVIVVDMSKESVRETILSP